MINEYSGTSTPSENDSDRELLRKIALAGPGENAEAVSPSDSADLSHVSRALWIGGAGNVAVITNGGQTVTFTSVAAGTLLPIRATRVNSTNTTATNIVALW